MQELWMIYNDRKPPDEVVRMVSCDKWRLEEVQMKNLEKQLKSRLPDAAVAVADIDGGAAA